ncbi:Lpg1974 family pore-forming outer membrane protein [Simkania sp.]|uniref:Lpg1974 family pore-forming outer membrane protein n=1 Tax=Simkania sp. TaxID=34094 RepID=UPI003B5177A0
MLRAFILLLFLPVALCASAKDVVGTYPTQSTNECPTPVPLNSDPTPPKETITPSLGPISKRGYDVVVDAEFLYWYANVTQLSYAREYKLAPVGDSTDPTVATLVPVEFKHLDWGWDPGVRLGLGVVTNHEGWEVYSNWTYTYNSVSDTSSVPDYAGRDFFSTTVNPPGTKILTSPWLWLPDRDHFNRIKANWALLFNQIDLTVGRHFWISPRLSIQPFAGVRGFWARMHFSVDAFRPGINNPVSIQNQIDSKNTFKQKSWGVGLLGGLNTAWHITDHWSVVGAADLALAYGKTMVRSRIDNLQIELLPQVPYRDVHLHVDDNLYRLQSFVDLSLGLRWETMIHEVYRLLFDLAWETHFLLNFSQLFRGTYQTAATTNPFVTLPDASTDLPSSKGNLTLSGVVLRGRFEF